jgi:hypothetical protein
MDGGESPDGPRRLVCPRVVAQRAPLGRFQVMGIGRALDLTRQMLDEFGNDGYLRHGPAVMAGSARVPDVSAAMYSAIVEADGITSLFRSPSLWRPPRTAAVSRLADALRSGIQRLSQRLLVAVTGECPVVAAIGTVLPIGSRGAVQ